MQRSSRAIRAREIGEGASNKRRGLGWRRWWDPNGRTTLPVA